MPSCFQREYPRQSNLLRTGGRQKEKYPLSTLKSSTRSETAAEHTLERPIAGTIPFKGKEPQTADQTHHQPKFSLGRVVITFAVWEQLSAAEINPALRRHQAGDWGEHDEQGKKENERNLARGGPVASIFHGTSGVKFYVITEGDRSTTTVLLPEEY